MYEYIIVTHIPAFYKVNLYNELAKKMNILVIFVASDTNENRSDDFICKSDLKFDHKILYTGNLQERNVYKNIRSLSAIVSQSKYRRIIVGGWDLQEYWYLVFTNYKSKNCLVLESTINESSINNIRGVAKKVFLSRISTVFASGNLHKLLLDSLRYKGEVKVTKGVGIINKPKFSPKFKQYDKKYLFVGRLSKEKNIEMLIDIFNKLEDYKLTIVGSGPLEEQLKGRANENITFVGNVVNLGIRKYFETNDILVLTSVSETWGLVVEEALYYGVPVIVSSNCGSCEIIRDGINGYVVDIEDDRNIKNVIKNIDESNYQKLIDGVDKFSVEAKDLEQLRAYFAK